MYYSGTQHTEKYRALGYIDIGWHLINTQHTEKYRALGYIDIGWHLINIKAKFNTFKHQTIYIV